MPTLEDVLSGYLAQSQINRSKLIDDFLSTLNESELRNLLRKLQELSIDDRRKTSTNLSKIVKDSSVRETIKYISNVGNDRRVTKEDAFARISLFTKSAATPTKTTTPLRKRMFVKIDFSGLGSEHKGNHPAIVWYVGDAFGDRALVIPCTSYKANTTVEGVTDILIGKGKFFTQNESVEAELVKDTVVLLDQMQVVSRKRITGYTDRNPATNQQKTARIDDEQTRRIEEGLKIAFLGEKTLYDLYIRPYRIDTKVPGFITNTMVPEFSLPDVQYKHLYRIPLDVKDCGCFISYRVEDDTQTYFMFRRPVASPLSKEERDELLEKWYKPKAVKDGSGNVVTPTSIVRQGAYNAIISKKQ